MSDNLSALTPFAVTPRQKEVIEALERLGSNRKVAEDLGVKSTTIDQIVNTVRRRAAAQGVAPGHWKDGVAPGYRMGKVTVHRKDGKVEQTWERQHPDEELMLEVFKDALAAMAEGAGALIPITPPPAVSLEDMLSVYGMGDPHFGMYAWAEEAGEDFNLEEADRLLKAAIDRLVTSGPASHTALLLNVGDLFHADNNTNRTPASGHSLDVDTRHPKVMMTCLLAFVYAIRRLLEKHQEVIVWSLPGNHDENTGPAFAIMLWAFFQNEPRVKIDLKPGLYKYMRFGKVLIGSHHGHGAKLADLPQLMATDCRKDWGLSEYAYWYTGHIHHKTKLKEFPGVEVESLRTLAPRDAWHAGMGYRAGREMILIVHHRNFGERERHRCDAAEIAQGDQHD